MSHPNMFQKFPNHLTKGAHANGPVHIRGMSTIANTNVSLSGFVGKLETFVRMAGLDYTSEKANPGNSEQCPRNKVPVLVYGGEGGDVVSDSTYIIDYLENTYGDKLETHSTDALALAIGKGIEVIVEEKLVPICIMFRWLTPEGYEALLNSPLTAGLPREKAEEILGGIRIGMADGVYKAYGLKHSFDDIVKMADVNLSAISTMLGDKDYITGKTPCRYDATLYAMLDNLLNDNICTKMADVIKSKPTLVAFHDRVTSTYFPPSNPSQFK